MSNISDRPPLTNRGVQNTCLSPQSIENQGFNLQNQYLLFDWIQATIFPDDIDDLEYDKDCDMPYQLFEKLFGVPREQVCYNLGGLFGYSYTYYFRHIKIFVPFHRKEMGIHIYISGTGCRDIEDLDINYYRLFDDILKMNGRFSRLDVSLDDYTDDYITIKKLKRYVENGQCVSKFKHVQQFIKNKIETGDVVGETLWFGSRTSALQIVFYNKMQERQSANFIVRDDIKHWYRCEMRFRSDNAYDFIQKLLGGDGDLNTLFKGVLGHYISFREPLDDSNKSRWPISKFWLDYLENVDRIPLQMLPIENSITKKRQWITKSVSKAHFDVFLSTIKDLNTDILTSKYLYEILLNGYSKIEKEDIDMINSYRIQNGLSTIEFNDITSFVKNIEDIVVLRKNDIPF